MREDTLPELVARADRGLARRNFGPTEKEADGAVSAILAAALEQRAMPAPYETPGESPPAFTFYHFVRGLDGEGVPAISIQGVNHHIDKGKLRLALRRIPRPWGDGGANLLKQLDKAFSEHPEKPDVEVPWIYFSFHFEQYVAVVAFKSPKVGPGSRTTPIQDLVCGVVEGKYFRFVHNEQPSADKPECIVVLFHVSSALGADGNVEHHVSRIL